MAKITRVWLDESEYECTMCGSCEAVCGSVFEVPEKMVIKFVPTVCLFVVMAIKSVATVFL